LWQGSAGIKDDLQAREKVPGQQLVVFKKGQQDVESARHVEIDVRCDVAQVCDRLFHQAWCRLAVVDVERSSVGQDHVEVVIATEGVIPRQPVDDDRSIVREKRPALADHLLVRCQHPVRVDHPLRFTGRARSEKDLGDRVGGDSSGCCVDFRSGAPGQKFIEAGGTRGHVATRDELHAASNRA
jgi:hypothetical protein